MTVLVTGGSGFFGVNLVRALAKRGDKVVDFSRSETPDRVRRFLCPYLDRVVFVQGDVLDLPRLQQTVEENEIDEIIHAATITATSLEVERDSSREVIEVNVMGSTNVFEVARRHGLRRTVYLSSGAIYPRGNGQKPSHEDDEPGPSGLYGISKVASEMIARRYRSLFGISIASVRMAQPYGPMELKSRGRVLLSPIHEWTHQALRGEEIEMQSLSASMDWCYVDDMASGVLGVLKGPDPLHDVYNLGSGRLTSVREMLEALAESIPGTRYRESSDILPNPNIDVRHLKGYLSIARISDEYGYQPITGIRDGIRRYIEWLRKNPQSDA